MAVLRQQCPWDRVQTHRSLIPYLVEETCEVVEAIEGRPGASVSDDGGAAGQLREELGDRLLQVVFHAEIAAESPNGFDLADVAAGISDKLIARHPHVFGAEDAPPDLNDVWERRKAKEKGRTSAVDGIPEQLSALSRASKVIARSRSHGVSLGLPVEPIAADTVGAEIVALVARAQANGIDAEQAVRDSVRHLERDVRSAETAPT
ncbi:MAG: MazG family protein [Microlunatus sp.]|nr:MazG family protein [Microlunatus sp.]